MKELTVNFIDSERENKSKKKPKVNVKNIYYYYWQHLCFTFLLWLIKKNCFAVISKKKIYFNFTLQGFFILLKLDSNTPEEKKRRFWLSKIETRFYFYRFLTVNDRRFGLSGTIWVQLEIWLSEKTELKKCRVIARTFSTHYAGFK